MRRSTLAVAAVSLSLIAGCPMPPSNAARMQQAASDFNTDVRFGRNELAVERVGTKEREEFLKHHKAWGKGVTLADYELVGSKLVDEDNAEVSIKYDWYHSDENELRVTTVKQKWQSHKGDWQLVGEACVDGDLGLFAESSARARSESPQPPRSVQFPTVKFGD